MIFTVCLRKTALTALLAMVVSFYGVAFTPQTVHAAQTPTVPTIYGEEDLDTYEENVFVVQYKNGTHPTGHFANATPVSVGSGDTQFWKVTIPTTMTTTDAYSSLSTHPNVVSIDRDYYRHLTTTTPDDPFFSVLWHLDSATGIMAEAAWDTQTGSTDIIVAVIDSGVDTDHPDLAANMWINTGEIAGNGIDDDGNGYIDDINGYDFSDNDGDPTPAPDGSDNDGFGGADSGVEHGTHVSGIIAAEGNNGTGVTGAAWSTAIMGVRVLDDEGSGTDTDIAEGIEYAVDNGADIINLSLGGYGSTTILEDSVAYAEANGVLIVAAAGNDGVSINSNAFYPACYSGVIGVSATDDEGDAASYSNFGTDCVDVAAPGSFIYSTYYTGDTSNGFTDDYGYMSGTSMATPVVAGIAALILAEDDTLTATQVEDIIVQTAEDIGLATKYGSGRVDVAAALAGLSIADNPTDTSISGYSNSGKSKQYTSGDRTTDTTPYFEWVASTDESGIDGYYVYFGTNENANPETAGTLQVGRTYSATVEAGNNISYFLIVSAVDGEGNVSTTAASHEHIVDTAVKKPKKVKGSRTSNGIKISWNKVKKESVQSYKILRKKSNQPKYKKIDSVSSTTLSYTDTTVKRNIKYDYKIRAVDDLKNKKVSKKRRVAFYPRERLVIAAGGSATPLVAIYNVKSKEYERSWYAFDQNTFVGVELAVGNFDGDKKDEIVTTKAVGNPEVRVYESSGKLKKAFLAYDPGFEGGVHVAAGDVDNDGVDEIITVPGAGGSAQVKVFEADGGLIMSFNAGSGGTGGAFVAAVNWNGTGGDEIVVAPGPGDGRRVQVFSGKKSGTLITEFDTYADGFSGGVRVADADFGGKKEVVLTVPVNGGAQVSAYRSSNGSAARIQDDFFGITSSYTGGGSIAAGDVAQKAVDRIIVGSNGARLGSVNVITKNGSTVKNTILPFSSFFGAISVASGWVF